MRRSGLSFTLVIAILLVVAACGRSHHTYRETRSGGEIAAGTVLREVNLDPVLEGRILGLDPERVSGRDVEEVLSRAPAPRIINIHGGIYPVHLAMDSFSGFLIGMGYPEAKIRHPRDGAYAYSCDESSRALAGSLAWLHEREDCRPMKNGHSQGGIQAVTVVRGRAGTCGDNVPAWNPTTK